ncbi:hypothetical protein FSP39_015905 [Pinctada imbricata]|uniref:Uncharacterized protein n=1 Tax=Pinctada imbricata TaxID=66713 RepID=A0AA88Y9M4_PINIB|nr:hypothetical protein FSP39_015905 [Pinctada imbricata]
MEGVSVTTDTTPIRITFMVFITVMNPVAVTTQTDTVVRTTTIAGAIIGGIICLAVIIAMVACCVMASKAKRAQRGGNVISPTNINVVQYSNHRPQQLHGAFPEPPPYMESAPAYPPGASNPSSSTNTRLGAFSPPPKYTEQRESELNLNKRAEKIHFYVLSLLHHGTEKFYGGNIQCHDFKSGEGPGSERNGGIMEEDRMGKEWGWRKKGITTGYCTIVPVEGEPTWQNSHAAR